MRRVVVVMLAVLGLVGSLTGTAQATVTPPASFKETFVLFKGDTYTEKGPAATPGGGDGNTYGPEIRVEGGLYRMWYGAQGVDGYEHIHYAESTDGFNWNRQGVVLSHAPGEPLVQDPSIVVVGGVYHMYYTVAHVGITDTIHHATSTDGINWTKQGRVLDHGPTGTWDDANVGRPSVLYDGGVWKMWYDGCQGLPTTDVLAPYLGESCASFRNVGYATSADGVTWTKHPANPIISPAEAIQVSKYRDRYVMLHENQQGTRISLSTDGVAWNDHGFYIPLSGQPHDEYGQVTPFLLYGTDGKPMTTYMGLARDSCWCQNLMGAARVQATSLDVYIDGTGGTPTGTVPPSDWVTSPDYSDTFTVGLNSRAANQAFPVGILQGSAALMVENVQGNNLQSWTDAKWAFGDDATHQSSGWPGGSGRGSATGLVETSWTQGTAPLLPNDWGISYGLRQDFVIQADFAVPAGATVNLTTADGRDSQSYGNGLTVKFRSPGTGLPEVGIFWPGFGEVDTGFHPNISAGQWHTYGARFNLVSREITILLDGAVVGTRTLASLGSGFAVHPFSYAAVSVGAELGVAGGAAVGWSDNFLVGPPKVGL